MLKATWSTLSMQKTNAQIGYFFKHMCVNVSFCISHTFSPLCFVCFTFLACVSPGVESDSVSSTANFVQERVPQPHRQRDQNQSLLDKLTQEKLDTKTKTGNKPNDLSSGTKP